LANDWRLDYEFTDFLMTNNFLIQIKVLKNGISI